MSLKFPSEENDPEKDPVWDLLSRDASRHPVTPSPWFAARTTAALPQSGKAGVSLIRWLLPIPLAAVGALVMLLHHAGHGPGTYVSSEAEFEQHMELLYASVE